MDVKIREKSVRGTVSNRLKTKDQDPAKLDAAIEIQTCRRRMSPPFRRIRPPSKRSSPCAY